MIYIINIFKLYFLFFNFYLVCIFIFFYICFYLSLNLFVPLCLPLLNCTNKWLSPVMDQWFYLFTSCTDENEWDSEMVWACFKNLVRQTTWYTLIGPVKRQLPDTNGCDDEMFFYRPSLSSLHLLVIFTRKWNQSYHIHQKRNNVFGTHLDDWGVISVIIVFPIILTWDHPESSEVILSPGSDDMLVSFSDWVWWAELNLIQLHPIPLLTFPLWWDYGNPDHYS